MKRSFLTVLAASSALAFGACGGDDMDTDIEPVEEVQPPPPAPMPMDTMMMDTMMMDTMRDTMPGM
jgi:hypothetical protein